MIHPIILVITFVVSSLVGYFVIRKIPGLLHTPLMSGMNALSGITVVGAIIVLMETLQIINITSFFVKSTALYTAAIIGGIAIILAMINVVGGFQVTNRMLQMFAKKKGGRP